MAKRQWWTRLTRAFGLRASDGDTIAGDRLDESGEAAPGLQASRSPEAAKLREAFGVGVDTDEQDWRRLSGDADRDLTPLDRQRMRQMSVYLWQSNLLANRMIELAIAYLLAEGVQLTVKDAEAQKFLDAFWHDPINRMDLKLAKKVRELYLHGEQCWPVFVNEISGHVRMGTLDPGLIEKVIVDPDNPEQPIGVMTVRDSKGARRKYRIIVPGREDVFTERTRKIRATFDAGECFYYSINDLTTVVRGHGILLGQVDWLDAYEQFLFGEVDRARLLRSFVWDVTINGATPEQAKERAKDITAPKANSVRVHNEAEKWEALAPTLNASENAETARLFRNHMLGGRGFPEHWFGGGGDVNRATAGEMGDPTFKTLSMDQQLWKLILQDIGRFVVSRGFYPDGSQWVDVMDEELMPQAIFPALQKRDVAIYSAALNQVVAGCASAIDRGLLTDLTAVRLINAIATGFGIEFDAEAELKAAKDEAAKRREEDSFTGVEDDPEDDPQPAPAV